MSTTPLLFTAQAPDLIGNDAAGATLFTSNFTRYAPMPGARENRWVYTLESETVGVTHWVNTGTGTLQWLADIPIDSNGAGGGPGASFLISSAGSARFHTDNGLIQDTLRFRSREVHCASIEVMHQNATARNVRLQIDELGTGGPTAQTADLAVPANQWTRVYFAYTPTRKPTCLIALICNTALGWANGETVYVRRPMLEPGVSVPGEWFSGNSAKSDAVPGPKWLDARTGYGRTPCTGISVAHAGWFLVSDNSQLVKNPYGTINTTDRAATNGSLARTTDYAIQGTASIRLTASGANTRDTATIVAPLTGTLGLDAVVINEQSSARTARLIVAGSPIAGTTISVPAYGETWIRGDFAAVSGNSYVVGVEWTNSANTETFVTEYLGCLGSTANSSRHAAYPTPPLKNDGTIDISASWGGTAHDSVSTLSGSSLIAGHLNTHARSQRGSAIVRLMRSSLVVDERIALSLGSRDVTAGYPEQLQLWAGPTNPETFARAYAGNTGNYAIFDVSTFDNAVFGPMYGASADVAGQAISGDTLVDLMMEWDGDLFAVELLGSWRIEGSRAGQSPHGRLTGVLEIGCCQDLPAQSFDGLISAVAIANRPLTLAEKDRIHAAPLWPYTVLDDLQPGYVATDIAISDGLQLAIPTISSKGFGYGGGSGGSWDMQVKIYRSTVGNKWLENITDRMAECTIEWDDSRDVKGGGSITLYDRSAIDAQVDLIVPYLIMTREDGTIRERELGLYLTSMPSGEQDMDSAQGVYQLRDVTELLSRSVLKTTYNVAGGTSYLTALATLASAVGLSRLVLPDSATAFAAGDSQRKGNNRLAIFNGWCRALGWQEVSADMRGRLVTQVQHRIRDVEPFATLTEDDFFDLPRDEPQTENFGNIIVVRAENPAGTPIVSVASNDDIADPISTVNIGEHPLPDVSDPNITTQSAADDLAQRLLEKAGSWERVVSAKILADPRIGINRSMDIQFSNADGRLDGRYWVRKWSIDLTGDGTMDLEMNRVVRRAT
jgi:hypothetical protein